MTTAPRVPQDHKSKASDSGKGRFTFTHKGESYTLPKPFETVQNPKYLRANRRRDELDLTFTMIEDLCGDTDEGEKILDVIDTMTREEFNALSKRLGRALMQDVEDVAGESEAS
jgi:hypothetical protein